MNDFVAVEAKNPPLSIWEKPLYSVDYVMGIDTGEGLGQEYSVCDVYCKQTGCQVAQYITNQQDPEEFALSCVSLGRIYHLALAVVEINNAGQTVMRVFKEKYQRNRIWRPPGAPAKFKTPENRQYGWMTTRTNRSQLIYDFKAAVKTGIVTIRSQATLSQMKSFIRKKEGRIEHAEGECDDAVFAGALAYQGFKGIRTRPVVSQKAQEGRMTMGEYINLCRGVDRENKRKPRTIIIGKDLDHRQHRSTFVIGKTGDDTFPIHKSLLRQ